MLKLPVKSPIVNENIDLSEYAKKSDVDAIDASLDNKAEKKEARKKHRKETHFTLKLIISVILSVSLMVGTIVVLTHFNIVNFSMISDIFTGESDKAVADMEKIVKNATDSFNDVIKAASDWESIYVSKIDSAIKRNEALVKTMNEMVAALSGMNSIDYSKKN